MARHAPFDAQVAGAPGAGMYRAALPPLLAGDPVSRLSESLTAEYLEEQRLLPLHRDDSRVRVAFTGSPDPQALGDLGVLFERPIVLVEVPEEDLLAAIRRTYGADDTTAAGLIADLGDAGTDGGEETSTHDLAGLANQAPVVRLVNLLLAEAVATGASDVHLETDGQGLQVRYRVDGVLQEAPSPPSHLRAAIVSRLKIMAELDIAERRVPQDGRARLRVDGRAVDVRVSTLPTLHGESVVLRLLEAGGKRIALEQIGLPPDLLAGLLAAARRPQGVLLATGPTGSGKTTTLYALLDHVRTGREKIVSVEEPVEFELPGVAQVPVHAASGLTFARALRSILRQDPDVLLVGEMRDPETAEICIQAALTGHLVLSTLHTNDAPSALTRLLDLRVADYLVASTVEGVLAQRLVRLVCTHCAEHRVPTDAERRAIESDGHQVDAVRFGTGCPACRGTGYRRRIGIFEFLRVDDELRAEVLQHRGASVLRQLAIAGGMRPLRSDGWLRVAAGLTTPSEVMRVA